MSHFRMPQERPLSGRCRRSTGLLALQDKTRVGARHKGTVKREIHQGAGPRFRTGCDVTLVGSADLAALAQAALSCDKITDREYLLKSSFLSETAKAIRPAPIAVVLALQPIIRCLMTVGKLAPWPLRLDRSRPAIARRSRFAGASPTKPMIPVLK